MAGSSLGSVKSTTVSSSSSTSGDRQLSRTLHFTANLVLCIVSLLPMRVTKVVAAAAACLREDGAMVARIWTTSLMVGRDSGSHCKHSRARCAMICISSCGNRPCSAGSGSSALVSSGAPERVVQAFTMLQDSPEAQDVVASLASDQNVWNAVMRNEKVMKFYKTYATKLSEDEVEGSESDSVQNSSELTSAGEAFMGYVEKMKALVSEMVTNLSSIMQDLVATSDEGQSKGKLKTMIMDSKKDFANAPSAFVLLAIASIMVVLLKRA